LVGIDEGKHALGAVLGQFRFGEISNSTYREFGILGDSTEQILGKGRDSTNQKFDGS